MIIDRNYDEPGNPAQAVSQHGSEARPNYKLLAPKPHQRITPTVSLRPPESPESSGQAEPRRPQTRQEWDAMKDIVRQLYLVENLTLEEVANTMLRDHSFAATKRMYKRQFKRWNWKKYNTQSVQEGKETGRFIEMSQGQTTCRRPMRNKRNINIESAWVIRRRHGSDSSARVPNSSAMPPTKLSCANGDDKRTLQLYISLRDLIHGTFQRNNAGWSSGKLRFTGLPTTGRLLVSQIDQAIRLFESKHHKQGGMILREAFRNLEDVIERDAIEIYQVVLLYIPFYLPGRYKDVTRAWLHYTSQLLSLKKRQDPISQLAKLLYSIHSNNAEQLAPALERLFSITADTYSQLRGMKDLSTLMATVELLLAKGDLGTSQESTLIVEKLGSLVAEAAAQFGETSEKTVGIEAYQITSAARLILSPVDTKIAELCRKHVSRVSAAEKTSVLRHRDCGASSGHFIGGSHGHDDCVHCGGLETKETYSTDLVRALEAAKTQAGFSDTVISPGQTSRQNRLFWREILQSLGRAEEAVEVWRGSFSRYADDGVECDPASSE